MLSERSVAAWQVVGGICAAVTLVAAVGGAVISSLSSDEEAQPPSENPAAAPTPAGTAAPPPEPVFSAREVKYLSTMKPVKQYDWWGEWTDAPAVVNDVEYRRAMSVSTCGYDLYREYLVKRDFQRFRADVGIADDTEDATQAEIRVADESGAVLYQQVVRPGEPARLDVPIDDVLRLKLEVGEGGCATRTVVWGDARVER